MLFSCSTHYFQGVETNRYVLDRRMFDMSLRRNRCFCSEGRDWKDCDGWSDMSACLFGAPAGISFPHFLYTPRRLAEVDGLNPDPEKHFGFLEFETNLAAPGILRLCLQGVLDISPVPSVAALSGLPTVKLPVFWVKLVIRWNLHYFNRLTVFLFAVCWCWHACTWDFIFCWCKLSSLRFNHIPFWWPWTFSFVSETRNVL